MVQFPVCVLRCLESFLKTKRHVKVLEIFASTEIFSIMLIRV